MQEYRYSLDRILQRRELGPGIYWELTTGELDTYLVALCFALVTDITLLTVTITHHTSVHLAVVVPTLVFDLLRVGLVRAWVASTDGVYVRNVISALVWDQDDVFSRKLMRSH